MALTTESTENTEKKVRGKANPRWRLVGLGAFSPRFFLLFSVLSVSLWLTPPLAAHPVPRRQHDRTIVVRLGGDPQTGRMAVTVDYRLEVAEATVVFDDLPAVKDKE